MISGVPDVPEGSESHGPIMISGVLVPEIVEEINDAYDDLLVDIGKYREHLPTAIVKQKAVGLVCRVNCFHFHP